MKIRPANPGEISDEEAEEAKLASEMGLIREGSQEELSRAILDGKEVVLGPQVMEFLKENGITVDQFMSMLLGKNKN
jgi:hypothetical protein